MRPCKIVLAILALGSAPALAHVHHGSNTTTGVAPAHKRPRHTTPVRPADDAHEHEHGWGPFRKTDW